ncbi:hypothetical protein Bca52824_077812 [Brassica carinata]|uniref:Uncharacterized protein n=2 Tax=Brassica TaxID=3705 RepID=A0A8X7PWP6_BRACI|nr:hypothetical protein Bca52824_077812 [Brassica carinata]
MELWRKKKEKCKAKKCFLKNGSVFLQELIADCNGISNPIRMFSSDQIFGATSRFDLKCCLDENMDTKFTWYKGDIEGRPYGIKRHTEQWYVEEDQPAYNDIG